MELRDIEEIREEADQLGLKYAGNIGAEKLQAKVDEEYARLENETNGPTVTAEEVVEEDEAEEKPANKKMDARAIIREQEKANKKTKVVTVSMVDKRESSYATSVYYSTGGVGMRIPLDIPCEVPIILIRLIEDAKSLIHTEVDGNTVSKYQKKFVVEYK